MRKAINVMIAFVFAVVFVCDGAQGAHAQGNQGAPSRTDNNKAATATSCSLLTAGTIEKVMGQSLWGNPQARTAPPMYGGASGSSCTYIVGAVRIELTVYTEASSAKAKQDFDTYGLTANDSKGKPSIGDSAYWVEPHTSKSSRDSSLSLFVLKGKVHFSIKMTPANEKQLKDLAAAAAAGI
ncbi:MAG TPA: hypothetical protein VGP35_06765 [Terriglobales bacterium]|jgi:hypothetical protein|nr:hypothetical protein [Terriglobales bacterium]